MPLLIIIFFLLSGCSWFQTKPTFQQVKFPQKLVTQWVDDGDQNTLRHAITQSIRYYERLPETRTFQYGEQTYTAAQMIQSMRLMQDLLDTSKPTDLIKNVLQNFWVFESRNSEGHAFFTGYYEPLLQGSLTPTDEFPVALYEVPNDLITVRLSSFRKEWAGKKIIGRLDENQLIPYDDRNLIVYEDSLLERANPIVYVDPIEQFFLQIQGSGLVELPDGSWKRVNYAQSNGRPYRAIGRILKDQIPPEQMSLQALKTYLQENPDEVKDILNYNPSYTFFREVEEGPLGNIEVPLTPLRSIAMDHRIIPKGSLAFIQTEQPVFENHQEFPTAWKPLNRFVLVQDTGGAIRRHGRVDIFWGNGNDAELSAGHMKQPGRVFLLVAKKQALEAYVF